MDTKESITYNKILIINLGGIGDVLLSTPALRALKSFFSQATIAFVVVPRVYEAVNDLPYVDETIVLYRDIKNFFRDLRSLLILRKKHFDLAINMRTLVSKKSAKKIKLLLDIIKPKIKVGRDTEGRGDFFDIKIPETDKGEKYEMGYDIDIVEALGAKVYDRSIDFEIDEEAKHEINKILEKENISKDDIIVGVHPGGLPSHRWPIESFSEVMDALYKKLSCKFVITTGQGEISLARKLIKITNIDSISLVNKLSLRQLGALIKSFSLFISNDTGPMHLAAALKTPLIAIFGPGFLSRFDPRNVSDKAVVLKKYVDCSPCNKEMCSSIKCLRVITPEEVTEAALMQIQKYTTKNA